MSFDGSRDFPALPYNPIFSGPVDLGTHIACPPGGNVFFVRGDGTNITQYSGDPPSLVNQLSASINKALSYTVANRGDVVCVLPGHTENIATAGAWSSLTAGTKIIGLGQGTSRPTLTWTTATSTILLNKAGVTVSNLNLNLDPGTGTTTVAAPITVSGAGNSIMGCAMRTGTDANSLTTIPITTTAGATDLTLANNFIYGATTAECTTMIQLVGAVRARIVGNTITGATSSASVGVIRFLTTASTGVLMLDNRVTNQKALSSQAITGMAGISGFVDRLHMHVLSDNVAALTGAFSTAANVTFGRQCYVTNNIAERAALFGTESA